MKNDLKKLKSGGNVVVEVDKTSNLYQLDTDKYNQLLHENITKDYKIAPNGTKEDIDGRTSTLTRKLKIDDRMECYTETPCFITLKYIYLLGGTKVSTHTFGFIAPPCFIFEGCCFADGILYLVVRGFGRQNVKIRIF